ncbi:MAG TPA: molybdenum cofactor biosynthesis protein MoaE [Thermodesulfovibrionales bacterium]|nr:molybdenum cofactor biosynthesis protein MoaE [Thermodesulfovibrionales bacterium]
MIEQWIAEIKQSSDPQELGMILIHNGIVRATSKHGKLVRGVHLSYDREKLNSLVTEFRGKDGIVAIKAWINEGTIRVGDDIMFVLVAGRLRTDVLPTFEELISKIKKEVVSEKEFP